MNSTLQCLVHAPPFWHYIKQGDHVKNCGVPSCIHCELSEFTKQYSAANGRATAPTGIVRRTMTARGSGSGMEFGRMHDSQEFLLLLLDGLLNSNLRGAPKLDAAALDALERRTLQARADPRGSPCNRRVTAV